MLIHFHRNAEGEIIQLLIQVPIPFGHGWELSYIIYLEDRLRSVYGLVEVALIDPEGFVKII